MSPKNKRFAFSKLQPADENRFKRSINIREERKVKESLPKIVFSFKDFDIKQIPPGQSHGDWQNEKLLAYMLEKFGYVCGMDVIEAQQQKLLKIYGTFPPMSDFEHPQHIIDGVNWAVIMNIKGQIGRVAGHIIGNVFYVVFLDKNHRFYITHKKNT